MKEEIIQLIAQNNSVDRGLYIGGSLVDYVDKIFALSTIIPYYDKGELLAFISYYNNDELKQNSFLTLILVGEKHQGRGIGKNLLHFAINDLIKLNFKFLSLEVLKSNNVAISFYRSLGFEEKKETGEYIFMQKELRI